MRISQLIGLILCALSLNPGVARADVVLLVHGYQGNVLSWELSGVVPVLQQFGWKRAGLLLETPLGLRPISLPWPNAQNKVVNLQLNSEAPLSIQANVTTAALLWLRERYPDEEIIIVGHSLGGLSARLGLVRSGAPNVKALITIASPHQGTVLAYKGLDEIDDPFPLNKIKEFFGGSSYDTLGRSEQLLHDIVPPVPGKLLYWLNTRQHPPIKYYSIVRSLPNGMLGDVIVPGYSQDMANIPSIGQQSTRYIQGFHHGLTLLDGYQLVNILEQL